LLDQRQAVRLASDLLSAAILAERDAAASPFDPVMPAGERA
jgi:hypothetical protein